MAKSNCPFILPDGVLAKRDEAMKKNLGDDDGAREVLESLLDVLGNQCGQQGHAKTTGNPKDWLGSAVSFAARENEVGEDGSPYMSRWAAEKSAPILTKLGVVDGIHVGHQNMHSETCLAQQMTMYHRTEWWERSISASKFAAFLLSSWLPICHNCICALCTSLQASKREGYKKPIALYAHTVRVVDCVGTVNYPSNRYCQNKVCVERVQHGHEGLCPRSIWKQEFGCWPVKSQLQRSIMTLLSRTLMG